MFLLASDLLGVSLWASVLVIGQQTAPIQPPSTQPATAAAHAVSPSQSAVRLPDEMIAPKALPLNEDVLSDDNASPPRPFDAAAFRSAVQQANAAMRSNEWAQAASHLNEALAIKPDSKEVAYNLGVAEFQQGKFPDAQKAFQQSGQNSTADLAARSMYNQGNSIYADAMSKLPALPPQADPNHPKAATQHQTPPIPAEELSQAVQQVDRALTHFKDAAAANPDDEDSAANAETSLKLLKELKELQQQQQQQQQQQKDQQPQEQKQDPKQDKSQQQSQDDSQDKAQQPPEDQQQDQKQDQKQKQQDKQSDQQQPSQGQSGQSNPQDKEEPQQSQDPQQSKDQPQQKPSKEQEKEQQEQQRQQSQKDQKGQQDHKDQQDPQDQQNQKGQQDKKDQPQQQTQPPQDSTKQSQSNPQGSAEPTDAPLSQSQVNQLLQVVRDKESQRISDKKAQQSRIRPTPVSRDW